MQVLMKEIRDHIYCLHEIRVSEIAEHWIADQSLQGQLSVPRPPCSHVGNRIVMSHPPSQLSEFTVICSIREDHSSVV